MTAPALTVYVTGQGVITGDQLNTFVQSCDNLAQLRAFVGTVGQTVAVRGYTSPGDGGAGDFEWNATATGTDNNSSFIVPQPGLAGAWIRLASAAVAVNYYAIDSGTVNAMIGTYDPVVSAYEDGMILYINPAYSNTSAVTFNAGAGALSVVGPVGALQGGEIVQDQIAGFQYSEDNSNWLMISGWGAQQVVAATESDQAVNLSQIQTDYAPAGGSGSQTFLVAAGTTGDEAVNFSQFPTTNGASQKVSFPGGFTIITGSFTATQNSSGSVTFAAGNFASACSVVVATPEGTGTTNSTLVIYGKSTTGFSWTWPATASNSETVNYIAMGY